MTYLSMLLNAAFESASLRVAQKVRGLDPYLEAKAYDAARTACIRLGYFCKVKGGDARQSPLYESLEFKEHYVQAYEHWRKVTVEDLSPKIIFEVTARANILTWQGFEVFVIGQQVPGGINDGHGAGALVISDAQGEVTRFEGLGDKPHERARLAYRQLTGVSHRWDDGFPMEEGADLDLLAQT